jgi:hypothetical protein
LASSLPLLFLSNFFCPPFKSSLTSTSVAPPTLITPTPPESFACLSLSFSKSLNADYLMLSDETATSNKFLTIINWLKNFNKADEVQKIKTKKNNKFIETNQKDIFFC